MAKKLTPKEAAEIERAKKIAEFMRRGKEALTNPKLEDAPPLVQDIVREHQTRMQNAEGIKPPTEVSPSETPIELNPSSEVEEPKQSSTSSKSQKKIKKVATARKSVKSKVTPSVANVAEEVVEESPILRRFGSLSDDVMKRIDPVIQKVLQNKNVGKAVNKLAPLAENPYVTKGVPLAGMAYEGYQLADNLGKKEYIDAAGNALGVAAGGAMLAGAAIPAMALGATSAGIAGAKALGEYAAEHTKHTPEEIRGVSQFADRLENSKTLQEKLGTGFGGKFNPPYGKQKNNPDYINHLKKTGLSDEQIIKKINEYETRGGGSQINRTIDLDKIPSKAEVIEYTIEKAKKLGIDPAFALAQMQQESGFKLGAISQTGAKGLTQMFPKAFNDAKSVDEFGDLQDLDYNQVFGNDSNWKKQIDAGLLYNKAISKRYNKSGTDEEQLLRYHGGPDATPQSIGSISGNPNAHKQYVRNISSFKNRWNDILNNEDKKIQTLNSLRTQKSEFFNPELSSDLSLIRDYLESPVGADQEAFGKVITKGPFPNIKNYSESMSDAERLSNLKNLYLAARKQKEESTPATSEPTTPPSGSFKADAERLVELEKGFTENQVKNLKEVQDEANAMRRAGLFLEAFEKMGRGISGAMSGIEVKAGERNKFFEEQAKVIEDQFKERAAKEGDDPESQFSASMRNLAGPVLEDMGLPKNLLQSMSGNQINKVFPQLEGMYNAKIRQQYVRDQKERSIQVKKDAEDIKRFDKMGAAIIAEKANPRSTFGTDSKTLASTQNIRLLLTPPGQKPVEQMTPEEKKDYQINKNRYIQEQEQWLNGLDAREQYEVARALDRVLSQSGATISGSEKLTPKTFRGWVGSALEYLTNQRVGAGGADFMKRFQYNLDREEAMAADRIRSVQKKVLAPYKDLKQIDPDKWKLIMRVNGILEDPFEEETNAAPVQKEDKDIRDLANRKFKGDYNSAKKWLISTGQIK
jgi:hypothetical protein